MFNINVSIVLFHTDKYTLIKALESLFKNKVTGKIYLVDNSKDDSLKELAKLNHNIEYIYTGKNLGYGKAHNIALRKSIQSQVKYHIVMNPDVYFEEGVIEKLYKFMEQNPEVGLVMPKVLNPDGSLQYLCKHLPTPMDLIGRRFFNWGPFRKYMERRNYIYEMRYTGYKEIMDVPFLSGSFMFLKVEVLKKVGLFDERFFLYCDDLDLSRRIHRVSRTVFYPHCEIYHEWGRGSYKSFKLLLYHIRDAIKYFNKWGWIRDPERLGKT